MALKLIHYTVNMQYFIYSVYPYLRFIFTNSEKAVGKNHKNYEKHILWIIYIYMRLRRNWWKGGGT